MLVILLNLINVERLSFSAKASENDPPCEDLMTSGFQEPKKDIFVFNFRTL